MPGDKVSLKMGFPPGNHVRLNFSSRSLSKGLVASMMSLSLSEMLEMFERPQGSLFRGLRLGLVFLNESFGQRI